MFGGSLPSPVATNPRVWNSQPLCGTAQRGARAEPSHPCSCMCVGAPSSQHQIECPFCRHRCWFCKLERGQARGARDEAACPVQGIFDCWCPPGSLPVKDFPEYHCCSCRQVASNDLKRVLASCTPAPVGCAMLLVAAACLKWFLFARRQRKTFRFEGAPPAPAHDSRSWGGSRPTDSFFSSGVALQVISFHWAWRN